MIQSFMYGLHRKNVIVIVAWIE